MANAVCVRCGVAKRSPISRCGSCAFDPRGDDEAMARSILLSVERYEDGTDRKRYHSELDEIGQRIQRGEQVALDEVDVQREIEIVRLGKQATGRDGLKAFLGVMLWLWPLWVLGLLGLYLALR